MNRFAVECAILNLLMLGDRTIEIYTALNETLFQESTARKVYFVARKLMDQYGKIDLVMAQSVLQKNEFDSVMSVFDGDKESMPRYANWQTYVQLLKQDNLRQEISIFLERMKDNPTEREIMKGLTMLSLSSALSVKAKQADDLIHEAIERANTKKLATALYTGFPTFDRCTYGFRGGEIYVFGARPNVGKTNVLAHLSLKFALEDQRVLFMSSEMRDIEIVWNRILPMASGLNAQRFRDLKSHQDLIPEIQDAYVRLSKKKLFICDHSRPGIAEFRLMIERTKPNIVFIDYLQRCSTPEADSRVGAITEFMIQLKTLAKEYDVPVVLVAHLNREQERGTGEPKLADLRESGGIENEADVVALMWVKPDMQPLDRSYRIINVLVLKNRNGPFGIFDIRVDGGNLRIVEIDRRLESDKGAFNVAL